MERARNMKDTKERLSEIIRACADEIAEHGVEALWSDDEYITGGHIHVDISADMMVQIHFTRDVLPASRVIPMGVE